MKFLVPLLALAAFSLTACSSDATRRELYSPKKGDGYWTRQLEGDVYKGRLLADARRPGATPVPYRKPFPHFKHVD